MTATKPESPEARAGLEEPTRQDPGGDRLRDLYDMPGYLVRRAKQKSTSIFVDACARFGMTPPQYAVLRIIEARPGLDQGQIADIAALDESTTGGVLNRLQKRGLIQRKRSGRRQVVFLTSSGDALLAQIAPAVAKVQQAIVAPLNVREQAQLLRLLSKLTGTMNRHHKPRRSGKGQHHQFTSGPSDRGRLRSEFPGRAD